MEKKKAFQKHESSDLDMEKNKGLWVIWKRTLRAFQAVKTSTPAKTGTPAGRFGTYY